jgi:GNAT superfamily N-acetyltransferase
MRDVYVLQLTTHLLLRSRKAASRRTHHLYATHVMERPEMTIKIRPITPNEATRLLPVFSDLLVNAVAHGASVNFMTGLTHDVASSYWTKQIAGFAGGDRIWLVAEDSAKVVGMVMCVFFWQPNQCFRGEVSKMIVHSNARQRGIGAMLMTAIEQAALKAGKTNLFLDTETGSAGERLYRRMGWTELGAIPNVAYRPDGSLAAATLFYKELAPPPVWGG